jgi:hypothetical protein
MHGLAQYEVTRCFEVAVRTILQLVNRGTPHTAMLSLVKLLSEVLQLETKPERQQAKCLPIEYDETV